MVRGASLQYWKHAWHTFWKGPDVAILVAGGEGERQVAYVRVVVVALLMITPIYRLFLNPTNAEIICHIGNKHSIDFMGTSVPTVGPSLATGVQYRLGGPEQADSGHRKNGPDRPLSTQTCRWNFSIAVIQT